MSKSQKIRSYAKINLGLSVIGKRPDAFHELDGLFQNISLSDDLTLTKAEKDIAVACLYPGVPQGKDNIAYRAAELFFKNASIDSGIDILIEKSIPAAAGLGGGSANAAAVLIGLDRIFDAKLSRTKLFILAEELGSDVPFFIEGGTAHCRGRGEIIEKLPAYPETWMALVVPDFEVKAKFAYDEHDKMLALRRRRKEPGKLSSVEISSWSTSSILHNDLEEPVAAKHKEIAKIKELLISLGAVGASMSGSGPAVFGLAKDQASASKMCDSLKKEYRRVFLCRTIDRAVEFI